MSPCGRVGEGLDNDFGYLLWCFDRKKEGSAGDGHQVYLVTGFEHAALVAGEAAIACLGMHDPGRGGCLAQPFGMRLGAA